MKRGFSKYSARIGPDDFLDFETRSRLNAENSSRAGVQLAPRTEYLSLVRSLFESPRHRTVPLGDLMKMEDRSAVYVALRHDVDDDPFMAVWLARCLAMHGMPGTFFLLHNSTYWGRWEGATFVRNPRIRDLVRSLIVAGAEIGLHIDPFGVERIRPAKGAAVLRSELEWLRELGADVRGVVAHNSAASYGAENFEIFKGLAAGQRRRVSFAGYRHRLQQLSLEEIGVEYEGNHAMPRAEAPAFDDSFFVPPKDAVRDHTWLRRYLSRHPNFERRYDHDFWILGRDLWAHATHGASPEFEWPLTSLQMQERLESCTRGDRVVLTIHPMYFAG
jgi:peptidoglycan/xylan/chitin deacetylase (PgdA/CDA1 family)